MKEKKTLREELGIPNTHYDEQYADVKLDLEDILAERGAKHVRKEKHDGAAEEMPDAKSGQHAETAAYAAGRGAETDTAPSADAEPAPLAPKNEKGEAAAEEASRQATKVINLAELKRAAREQRHDAPKSEKRASAEQIDTAPDAAASRRDDSEEGAGGQAEKQKTAESVSAKQEDMPDAEEAQPAAAASGAEPEPEQAEPEKQDGDMHRSGMQEDVLQKITRLEAAGAGDPADGAEQKSEEKKKFRVIIEDYNENPADLENLPDFADEEEQPEQSDERRLFSGLFGRRHAEDDGEEDEAGEEAEKEDLQNPIHVFDQMEDKDEIRRQLHRKVGAGARASFFGFLLGAALLWLGAAQTYPAIVPSFLMPTAAFPLYAGVNLGLTLLFALVTGGQISEGIAALRVGRIRAELLYLVALFFVIVNNILALIAPADTGITLVNGILAASGMVMLFADQSRNKKVRADHKFLWNKSAKESTSFAMEENLYEEGVFLTATLSKTDGHPLSRFFTNSYGNLPRDRGQRVILLLALVGALGVGAVSLLALKSGFAAAFSAASSAICMFVPITTFLGDNFAFGGAAKKLRQKGAVVVGYDSMRLVSEIDELVLRDSDLFGGKNLALCGIKVYGDNQIDEIIVRAASLLAQLSGPISSALHDVIDHRLELLQPVEEFEIAKSGLKGYVDGSLVLIGSRAFMRENFVRIADDGLEEKLTASGKTPLYVACDSRIAALLSFKYTADTEIQKALRHVVSLGIAVKVIANDPTITPSFIADKYRIETPIEVIAPEEGDEESFCEEPTLVVTEGNISAYIRAIGDCIRLKNVSVINRMIAGLNIAVGFLLVLTAVLAGAVEHVTMLNLLLLQLLWALPVAVISLIAKWMS